MFGLRNSILLALIVLSHCKIVGQSQKSWSFRVGNTAQLDYYTFEVHDVPFTKKQSWSNFISAQGIMWTGKHKGFGLGLSPYIGLKQIVFESIIPNTDKTQLADSVSHRNNQFYFYYRGTALVPQQYVYRFNYLKTGLDLSFQFKIKEKWVLGFLFGYNWMHYLSRNSPSFSMKQILMGSGHYSNSVYSTDVVTPFKGGSNISAGGFIGYNITQRIGLQLGFERTGAQFISQPLNFCGTDQTYFLRFSSINLSLNYTLY